MPEPAPRRSNVGVISLVVLAVVFLAAGVVLAVRNVDADSSTPADAANASSTESELRAPLTEDEAQSRLLTPEEVGAGFTARRFKRNTDDKLPCGAANPEVAVPPGVAVGMGAAASKDGLLFRQQV